MAKGNDGNYLQHSVEVAAATRLAEVDPNGIHVALAHGMKPFEEFEVGLGEPQPGLVRCRIKEALRRAGQPCLENEPAIVTAYRKTADRCAYAPTQYYPNSAELLRTIWSDQRLSGGIVEVCPEKHRAIVEAWLDSPNMRVCQKSWREEVGQGDALSCPDDLQVPWLFSMDPMTYKSDGWEDDDNLYEADFNRVSKALASFVCSGQPGIATLFVYNVWKEQSAFCQFAKRLAAERDLGCLLYSITHRGGNRNFVALLYAKLTLPKGFIEDAVEEIEDMALAVAMQASKQEYATREAERGRLVGTLVRMGFAKQSIELEHRDGRTLKATYVAESEAALLRHPRGLVQVRGNICYNAAGEPVSIGNIDEVAEVDESPMEVDEIVYGNRCLAANEPLHFDVSFDREDLFYELQGPFGILLSADSREDLENALEAELRLLLADYAEGDPAHMSSDAKKLREQLRGRFGL